MIYFAKSWWTGTSREDPGTQVDLDWPKPAYRPGWKVRYQKPDAKRRKGKIDFVFREGRDRLDFYSVLRLKNGEREIVLPTQIIERITDEC